MRVVFIVGLSCLVACGSNGNGPPSVDTNQANLCDQIAAVACYDLYQCCPEGQIEQALNIQNPESQAQCESDVHKQCDRGLATFEASLAAKRVTFNASVMNTCLKALLPPANECATVDATLPWTDACMMSPWTGNVADGGMCFYNFECAGVGSGTSFCAPNQTCMPLPGNGMPCSPQGCAQGNYCDTTTATRTCKPLQGANGACTSTAQCMKGLFCDIQTGTGTCQTLLAGGEPCTSSTSCESNDCLPGTCSTTNQPCLTSANCEGTCSSGPLTGNFCTSDQNCDGHCSVTTTTTCITAGNCPATETCVLYTCNQGTCVGDVECASTQVTVDYCSGPETELGALF
jgi:hypothetical protein